VSEYGVKNEFSGDQFQVSAIQKNKLQVDVHWAFDLGLTNIT
jgi:hypothetical protein